MALTSLTFLAFCVIVIGIYFIVPKKFQWLVLLVSSLIFLFYDNFSIGTLIQAIGILFSVYIFGRLIDKFQNTKKSKWFLIFGITIILGILIYVKYTNLFIITFNHILDIFKISFQFEHVTRVSLIGLSYYSLIMISYLIDIYRGTCKSEKNICKLALFMSYFPILNSGPFIRYNETKDKLFTTHKFNYDRLCSGLVRILWGIFKVLVISQRIGMYVDKVYGNLTTYPGAYIILAILLFPLQLYTNFSGSIDIIMGISEIIGIELPENFTTPFFSKSMTEFWRNWHITLGAWLRDYIFYPLLKSNVMQKLNEFCKKKFGKKIGKKIPMFLSMFVMWFFIGVWHGGAYTYIIGSGLIQFVFIFFEDMMEPISKKLNKKLGINRETFSYKLYQIIRTYCLFSISMIFFRAKSIKNAWHIIKGAFVWNPWILLDNNSLYKAGLDLLDFRVLIISLIVLFVVEKLARTGSVREKLFKQNIVFRWVILYALIFGIIIFGCYGVGYDPASFIYRNF